MLVCPTSARKKDIYMSEQNNFNKNMSKFDENFLLTLGMIDYVLSNRQKNSKSLNWKRMVITQAITKFIKECNISQSKKKEIIGIFNSTFVLEKFYNLIEIYSQEESLALVYYMQCHRHHFKNSF